MLQIDSDCYDRRAVPKGPVSGGPAPSASPSYQARPLVRRAAGVNLFDEPLIEPGCGSLREVDMRGEYTAALQPAVWSETR